MKRLITLRALAAVFVLSLGFAAGSSFAGHGHHHHGWFDDHHGWHGVAHVAYLRDELKLDARQEALWKEAAFAREHREARGRWFAVYDALNAEQKEKFRRFFNGAPF
jgi:hypothetical protein